MYIIFLNLCNNHFALQYVEKLTFIWKYIFY